MGDISICWNVGEKKKHRVAELQYVHAAVGEVCLKLEQHKGFCVCELLDGMSSYIGDCSISQLILQ